MKIKYRTLANSRGSRALHPAAVAQARKNRDARILVIKDHQERGIASRKELRELERIAGLPFPQVNAQ